MSIGPTFWRGIFYAEARWADAESVGTTMYEGQNSSGLPAAAMRKIVPAIALLIFLGIWQAIVVFGVVPNFLLPTPIQVCVAFLGDIPLLASHALTTLIEALIGLALGVLIGFIIAVLMDRFDIFYLAFNPLMTISQTIPTIAIAPLLVLWLGYGLLPKVVLVILTTFFPIATALISGFRSVDQETIDLLKTMGATRWQLFWYVKIPASAEQFFAGLRISATYAIVGAVISEWLGGSSGLGVYMTRVRKSFDYEHMFAVIIIISALSLALMGAIDVLARVLMPWNRKDEK